MGALAGPVVAGAIIMNNSKIRNPKSRNPKQILNLKSEILNKNIVIRDSKLMTGKQRRLAAEWIKENAVAWSVGEASVKEIEKLNILKAARLAMRRAIQSLSVCPEVALVDGLPRSEAERGKRLWENSLPVEFVVRGDKFSFSIAAASILAKVYRDEIMVKLADEYSHYGWDSNKGYGSLKHRMALKDLGTTDHHRKKYAPVAKYLT